MLNVSTSQGCANFIEQRFTVWALDAVKSHLYQFVRFQATINFGQYGGDKPFLADRYDRIQMVRGGPQGAALGGVNFSHDGIVA